jgi:hypothetical protein
MNLDERSLDWESEYIPQEAKRDRHHWGDHTAEQIEYCVWRRYYAYKHTQKCVSTHREATATIKQIPKIIIDCNKHTQDKNK